VFTVRRINNIFLHQEKTPAFSFEAIKNIREYFPEKGIYLIHLPEKEEARNKQYFIDIKGQVENLGVKYFPALDQCEWNLEMFY